MTGKLNVLSKMKNNHLAILLCILVITAVTPHSLISQVLELVEGKRLTKEKALEDYEILYSSLINYHPIPFAFTPESDLNAYYLKQKASLTDGLSEREFYLKAKKLIALLKCGRTSGAIAKGYYEGLAGQGVLLPFAVNRLENELFIKNTLDDHFGVGDQVLSINGITVETILQKMDSLQSRDGLIKTMVQEATALNF